MDETSTAETVRRLNAQNKPEVIVAMIDARDAHIAKQREKIEALQAKCAQLERNLMFHGNAIGDIIRAVRAAQRTHTASVNLMIG